jgi:putative transposase
MSRKETIKLTKEKRKHQNCRVFELKIIKSKCSKKTLKHLNKLFLETKWFYNYILSSDNIKDFNTKIKIVDVLNKDKQIEKRTINTISSQMKQEIKDRLFCNILSLSALKKKGKKIGKLKFKSRINSVPLKQYNNTFKINFDKSTVKLQGLQQHLKVKGLNQLKENYEIANAILVNKAGNYYLNVITYTDKTETSIPEQVIGIDFGCDKQLVLSNNIQIQYQIPISKKLKRLDRKIMKHNRKRSNNKYKDQLKREKEYNKLNNKKKDIKNKIVSVLTKNFKTIICQNESIKAWQSSNHGKKIQNTAISGIISALSKKAHTFIEVNKFFPSTKTCSFCNNKQDVKIDERIYKCNNCKKEINRDYNSALNIKNEGIKNSKDCKLLTKDCKLLTERKNVKLEETETSTNHVLNSLTGIPGVTASFCL